jgi:hypothetical protein
MASPRLNTERARKALQGFRFADLFVEELGWNNPASKKPVQIKDSDDQVWSAKEISQLSSFRVFEVTPAQSDVPIPNRETQEAIWKRVTLESVENILIFIDATRTQSLWLWMKREAGKVRPRRHTYVKGQPGDLFLSKLGALVVDLSELDEHGNLPITDTANRVRTALDVETITKVFFKRFKDEHDEFLTQIDGIPDEDETRWYASVILNRLMFVWFLQKKGFIDKGDLDYLPTKLLASKKAAKNRFFSHFLRDLFFEGFAKPEAKRSHVGAVQVGEIPYLNGGLFLPHGIEHRIEGDSLLTSPYATIRIPDSAFASIFELFGAYSWNLNDTPGGDDREINPDVLGYIFEKYINQKEFGAYYTRPEITEYLCEQTIHQLVLEAAAKHTSGLKLLAKDGLKKDASEPRNFDDIGDLLLHADGSLAKHLLQDVLPRLSLLDPACGSGAFLVAAMKTLLGLTAGLIGRCEAVQEKAVLQWIDLERKKHKAPLAYWLKKKIITENLFGVDIMEEAIEIAKLRLFLALVASAEKRDQLEPLPNIEFNLMHGNSLVGLLHVNPSRYDSKTGAGKAGQERMTLVQQPGGDDLAFAIESKTAPTKKETVGAWLAEKRAARYDELLREKNRLIDEYKKAAVDFEDLSALKYSIEEKKQQARAILDKLLLDEFIGLGIEFHQATWDLKKSKEGKPEKRKLRIDDICALQPFHWAYEFDEIIRPDAEGGRGGFDAIITNPPWETFQPDAKEFFAKYDDRVTKKSLPVKEFNEIKARLLRDSDIRYSWLSYYSFFGFQREYFRESPQYANQFPTIDGRKQGKDVNLFKTFVEQTTHLLALGGRSGVVIPSGIYTDLGTMKLREMLFAQTRITGLFGIENRKGVFEGVDSRFKFCVLTFAKDGDTKAFPAAFMRHDVSELATFPNADSLILDVSLIRRLSPDSISIMEFRSTRDITILEKMLSYPLLGNIDDASWRLELHREFNMTDDAALFDSEKTPGALPLYEGKMIWHFTDRLAQPRFWVREEAGRQSLNLQSGSTVVPGYRKHRLAYRSIASNTNERTLVSTVIPPCFTGNSLNVAENLDHQTNLFCISIFNSFCIDWVVRLKVTTNVNMFYIYQLPIPRLTSDHPSFRPLVERTARLVGTSAKFNDLLRDVFGAKATYQTHGVDGEPERKRLRAEIDALVAQLYNLTEEEFQYILATFPLVAESTRVSTLQIYTRLIRKKQVA